MREALRGLETRRVVTIKHGRGATVRPTSDWDPLDRLVIETLAGSPAGAPFAESYIGYARYVAPLVATFDLRRGETAAAQEVARLVAATDLRGDELALSSALARVMRAWCPPDGDPLRAQATEAFAAAVAAAGRCGAIGAPRLRGELIYQQGIAKAALAGSATLLVQLMLLGAGA